jgi:hypothetical protein
MELKHQFNYPADKVFPYFAKVENFISVHPILFKSKQLGEHAHLFYEKTHPLLPFYFTYVVEIKESLLPQKKVVMYSKILVLVKLTLTFYFTDKENNTSELREVVDIKAPFLIKQLFIKVFKSVHTKLFVKIEEALALAQKGV